MTASVQFRYGPVDIDLQGADADDHIFRMLQSRGTFYEFDLLEHLVRHGPRHGVYVDAGANIGNHSVFFGRFLASHVVAIEPNPALLPILRRNLRVNRVSATVLGVAVGAAAGTGSLVGREGFDHNAGAMRVVPAAMGTVRVLTLDQALASLEPDPSPDVQLIKLDLEGMELQALAGSTTLLDRASPDVVVEAAGEQEHRALSSFLEARGYQEVGRFCSTPTYHFRKPRRTGKEHQ